MIKNKNEKGKNEEKLAKRVYEFFDRSHYNNSDNTIIAKNLTKIFDLDLRSIRAIIRHININEQYCRLIISTNEGYYMPKENDYVNSIYYIFYLKKMANELMERTQKMLSKVKYDDKELLNFKEIPDLKIDLEKQIKKKFKMVLKGKVVIQK